MVIKYGPDHDVWEHSFHRRPTSLIAVQGHTRERVTLSQEMPSLHDGPQLQDRNHWASLVWCHASQIAFFALTGITSRLAELLWHPANTDTVMGIPAMYAPEPCLARFEGLDNGMITLIRPVRTAHNGYLRPALQMSGSANMMMISDH